MSEEKKWRGNCPICGWAMVFEDSARLGMCRGCRRIGKDASPKVETKMGIGVDLKDQVSAATPAIKGVGKDAPLHVNRHGGKQSDSPYRADLLQAHALLHLAAIMKEGAAKYGDNNWHKIPASENINHALIHLLSHLAGDTQDDHLGHAAWRILSALDQVKSGRDAKLKEVVK